MNDRSGVAAPGCGPAVVRVWRRLPTATVAAVGIVLTACGSSSAPAPPAAQRLAAKGCSWAKVFDPVMLNFIYPDTSVHYWLALLPNPGPLSRIGFSGRVPEVRYYALPVDVQVEGNIRSASARVLRRATVQHDDKQGEGDR